MPKPSYFKYDNHEDEWQKILSEPESNRVGETWFRTDTVDAWRHSRMRAPLNAFVQVDSNSSWLTVGDGRYGTDANYLLSVGAKNVHCSDISDTLLKIGNERGFIKTFSAENAESLSFADSSFDFVYCKESFHHFPRPYLALYEMFRVAKKAVILTEPRDTTSDRAPLAFILDLIKIALRRSKYQHSFEPVGNYIYSISEREIDKFLLGMHYNFVAYIGCNDVYIPGVEFVPIKPKSAKDKKIKAMISFKIKVLDLLCRFGIKRSNLITAALFKEEPSQPILSAMKKNGWIVRELPRNPYLENGKR